MVNFTAGGLCVWTQQQQQSTGKFLHRFNMFPVYLRVSSPVTSQQLSSAGQVYWILWIARGTVFICAGSAGYWRPPVILQRRSVLKMDVALSSFLIGNGTNRGIHSQRHYGWCRLDCLRWGDENVRPWESFSKAGFSVTSNWTLNWKHNEKPVFKKVEFNA